MRAMIAILAGVLLSLPAQGASFQPGAGEVRTGAFVGGRLRLSLGARQPNRLQAAAVLTPAQSYRTDRGRVVTRYGEGVALDFARRSPALMLGGIPARTALHLREQGTQRSDRKLGLSTGGWIAIGALVTVGAVVAITQLTCIGKDKDFCGSD